MKLIAAHPECVWGEDGGCGDALRATWIIRLSLSCNSEWQKQKEASYSPVTPEGSELLPHFVETSLHPPSLIPSLGEACLSPEVLA